MNWLSIFRFEFRYRRNRPATYLFFGLLLAMSLAVATTDMIKGLAGGAIKDNATVVVSQISLILFLMLGILLSSAIMGVAIVRDFEHRTDALFFTKPIRRWEYLTGRYLGAMLVLLLTLTAIPLGLMLGEAAPWRDADRLLPFRAATYWHPYFTVIVPNAFIAGTLFFTVGALTRKMLVVFVQGMAFLILYLISGSLLSQIDRREMASLLDPFGLRAMSYMTQYWSIAQQNEQLIPLADTLLWNRLLWLAIAALSLLATFGFFSYQNVPGSSSRKGRLGKKTEPSLLAQRHHGPALQLPHVSRSYGGWAWIGDLGRLTRFYAKVVLNDLPFLALSMGGLAMFLFMAFDNQGGWYDSRTLPTTYQMLNKMSIFSGLFLFILMVIYVGDLVWKERDVRIHLIEDALPVPGWVPLLGKYFGLGLAFAAVLTLALFLGVIIQIIQGGALLIDWRVYAISLYGETLLNLLIYMLLGFFVHVMVNNKFAGHALMILFFVASGVLAYLGVQHRLLQFNSASLGLYSDMNGFGHYVSPFSWLNLYWIAFATLLFAVAVVLSVRGSEELFKLRLRIGRHRLTRPVLTFGLAMVIVFVSSGSYIYYNTNVENKYQNSDESEAESAKYEKTLKKYAALPQPRITDVRVQVDLFPATRDFTATGQYILKNKTNQPIREIHLQTYGADEMQVKQLVLSVPNRVDTQYDKDFRYRMYHLNQPLQPGDSVRLDFKLTYRTNGFKNNGDNIDIVENGTFFTNQYLPSIGYDDRYELGSDDTRKDNDLKPKERMREQKDPIGLRQSVHGDDADQIRFAMTVSTTPDQIAIAPGYLQKEWQKEGRRYFSYAMDAPIANFYSIVSARYAVRKEVYKGKPGGPRSGGPVNLEIYYHPGHDRNLDRMMRGLKASLDYYEANFGPYQHRQLRIMEFPRYRSYAQSFANTIPFGESMGFVADIDDKKDIDMPFFVTAHETAHQWWGHQVTEADVKGSGMLSESLAEYSALMVMKQQASREKMQKFLRYELDYYLSGRHSEAKKEQPLTQCENQQYVHYNKGSLVLYALQDQIGEARLNQALHNYRDRWNTAQVAKTGIYPTAADLTAEIRAVTPDSLRSLVDEWVDAITLYELKTDKATAKPVGKQFDVTLTISAEKVRADSLGNEKPRPINEWMWIGVYAPKAKDSSSEKLLYYERHHITKPKQQIIVRVNQKPDRAGIDPLNLLIDRHPKDNVKTIE